MWSQVPLPRATDMVFDIIDMLHKHPLSAGEILDHVDAL